MHSWAVWTGDKGWLWACSLGSWCGCWGRSRVLMGRSGARNVLRKGLRGGKFVESIVGTNGGPWDAKTGRTRTGQVSRGIITESGS